MGKSEVHRRQGCLRESHPRAAGMTILAHTTPHCPQNQRVEAAGTPFIVGTKARKCTFPSTSINGRVIGVIGVLRVLGFLGER